MDMFTPEKRRAVMQRIHSTDTQLELRVRSALHRAGFRFRLHRQDLPGKPDIVLPRYRAVIFVHGCFWHGHNACKDGRKPKSNLGYWNRKLDRNQQRDRENEERLRGLGWTPITVWECETRHMDQLLLRLIPQLRHE